MNNAELQKRFKVAKANLTQQWKDMGIKTLPTDKEVWGQMRAVACQNKADALADDMEEIGITYQKRINAIDKILVKL